MRAIKKQIFIKPGENDPDIRGMSYNSTRDELFFTDFANKIVRVMHLRADFANVRDVYRAPFDISPKIYSVCHVEDLDTLVVCSTEINSSKEHNKNGIRVPCLLALSRYQNGWSEEARVKLEVDSDRWLMCSKLSES